MSALTTNSPEPFEPSFYTHAPSLTLASAIVLAQALVAACPAGLPTAVQKSCKQLATAGDAAQQAWADRKRQNGAAPEESTRVLDQEADGGWSNLRARLLAYASLPVALFPRARRAQEIVDTLFGDGGLKFLRETYVVQLSTMSVLLKRIDKEGLAAEIDELAGSEFLQHIRHVHPRYEAMVQAALQRESGQQSLLVHVRAIQRAVVAYATRVCATVEDDDAATIETARNALAAIEKMRLMASSKRESGAAPVPVPVPEPEPEPVGPVVVKGIEPEGGTPPKAGGK
jgi:hypothetical protein